MAGTRLAVHTAFVVQLLALVAISFLYASFQPLDLLASTEPFFVDKSGWNILVEDVSPADEGGWVDRGVETLGIVADQINALFGVESGTHTTAAPRPSAVFVQEMRQQISNLPSSANAENEEASQLYPHLKMKLRTPQFPGSSQNFVDTLQRGMKQHTKLPEIDVEFMNEPDNSASAEISCDEWESTSKHKQENLSTTQNRVQQRRIHHPEIIVLTGCTHDNIPDSHSVSVEIDSDGGIVVRTAQKFAGRDEVKQFIEGDVTTILAGVLSPQTSISQMRYRLSQFSIQLIDEDPTSSFDKGGETLAGSAAKRHHSLLGKALSASIQSTITPFLNDLSFLYGGDIDLISNNKNENTIQSKNTINSIAHTSAFLSIPDDIIVTETSEDAIQFVFAESLAKWINAHSQLSPNGNSDRNEVDAFEWVLYIPSGDHSPLRVRDALSKEVGNSIILSRPTGSGGRDGSLSPAGMSILNRGDFASAVDGNSDLSKILKVYEQSISQSFNYLVGYVRAIHGLPPSALSNRLLPPHVLLKMERGEKVSFWELDSIAREHWQTALEQTLQEMDALMSLMHKHASTLALPEKVAGKMNKATNLLRHSISLAKDGYPTVYATSLLYGSLRQLQSMRNDPEFMELSYFAPDHYLAVFSPLVLPLLLPMIVGLFREFKRYKDLKKKRLGMVN